MMKKVTFTFLFLLGGLILFSFIPKKKKSTNFTVVELFTSQGCHSCPPADKVLDELGQEYDEGLYLLAFHVDYWNNLGWEDPYSRPEYSKYQREYNNLLGEGVYTPMMIVNGKKAFVGSKKEEAISTVESEMSSNNGNYGMEAAYEEGALFVKYNPTFDFKNVRLNVAYVKKEAFTDIKSGENEGKILKYTHIVQRFEHSECNKEGMSIVEYPLPPDEDNFEIIAYLQNKNTYKILGACKMEF